jgi:hypothetical protein
MTHRLTRALTAAALTLAVGTVALAADPPADAKALDKAIVASLRDVHDRGADLYNLAKDYTGAYRMYEGGLVAVKPLLAHRPDVQKGIDDGLSAASREADVARKAFLLHETIEKVRAELKGVSAAKKTPEAKKPAETAKPKDTTAPVPKKQTTEPAAGTVSLSGHVTINGKPVEGGTVSLTTAGAKAAEGEFAAALIHADGTYALKGSGLPPGQYAVAITGKGVPEKYGKADTSGLTVEVKPGAGTFDFDLK